MNSNKSKEEKKYVQLSPDSVCHLAESVGLASLNPAVARALAEDASYRCRELANVSCFVLLSVSFSLNPCKCKLWQIFLFWFSTFQLINVSCDKYFCFSVSFILSFHLLGIPEQRLYYSFFPWGSKIMSSLSSFGVLNIQNLLLSWIVLLNCVCLFLHLWVLSKISTMIEFFLLAIPIPMPTATLF